MGLQSWLLLTAFENIMTKNTRLSTVLVLTIMSVWFSPSSIAQSVRGADAAARSASLKMSIQRALGAPPAAFEKEEQTKYAAAFVDLKERGSRDAIVYVTGRDWCGTAGCTLLILEPSGDEYKAVSRIPGIRLPVSVLATKSSGWHDIAVTVRPNGFEPFYRGLLLFDGKTYSVEPRRLTSKVHSKEVISTTSKSTPLYK